MKGGENLITGIKKIGEIRKGAKVQIIKSRGGRGSAGRNGIL